MRLRTLRECGLTPRSSGAPPAGHQGPVGGTRYIVANRALASCRRRPLTSNVRHHTTPASTYRHQRRTNLLGQSIEVDFLLHAGLGVAAASMLLVAFLTPPFFKSLSVAPWQKNLFNAISVLVLIASQLAVVAFMGAAKGIRVGGDSASIGYVVGIIVTLAVAWAVRRRGPDS